MRIWGCPAEAKLFNPQIGKLDSKTVSCHFIGYPDRSKGYRFYCPDRTTKFAETRHAIFLENDEISGSSEARRINLEEIRDNVPTPDIPQHLIYMPQIVVPSTEYISPAPTIELTEPQSEDNGINNGMPDD